MFFSKGGCNHTRHIPWLYDNNHIDIFHSRLIIWTEGGKKPGIRKSQPNGDNVETIIQGSAVRPISVVWDSVSGRIFWGDSGLNTVESVDVAGSNRKVRYFSLNRQE